MKITKARLKELIREELVNEGMGEDLKSMASKVYDMMSGRDEKKKERPPQARLFKPEEREIADAVATNKELLQKALKQLQDATEVLSDRSKHESEKISAFQDMQTARNNINRLLVYGVSAPLKEGENDKSDYEDMHDLAKKMDKVKEKAKKDPSFLKKLMKMLKDQDLTEGGERGEGAMADSQLNRIADLAMMIDDMVSDETNLPEWVESKITKAQDYMSAVMNYMKGEMADAQEEMMEEEKLTKPQIKDRDKRAKKIMKSTKKQYGKEEGEDIAYAIATNQVKEET